MLTEFSKERRRIEYQKNVINRAKNRARSNIRAWLKAGGIERVEEEIKRAQAQEDTGSNQFQKNY